MNIPAQYSTGRSRDGIERALVAAGRDLDHLKPSDLGMVEDFHTMGPLATADLVGKASVTAGDRVLDAGAGIGGTSRFLASQYGGHVTAIDLTQEFCETAQWLNELVGLDDKITVRTGDITDLPFDDDAFDVVISQHVQMNVPDKSRIYSEARRVLAAGGRLALWDICAGSPGELDYPLPWASRPELSHLVTPAQLRDAIESAGFEVRIWNDLTDDAAALMRAILAQPTEPLGLQAFVADFPAKAANLTSALADGRLRAIQAVAVAPV